MVLLSIGFASGKCDVYDRLNDLTRYFKDNGIVIGLVESDSNDMHFIKCVIKDEENSYNTSEIKDSFYLYAANILYDIIMDNFQSDVIHKVIKENYGYFRKDEAIDIAGRCICILNGTGTILNGEAFYYTNRKDRIIKKVYEYISDSPEMILEGFLRFRLKEFNNEIEDLVDKVVEEYLVEREYNEFIKLLKYFVEIQESNIEIVNIVINSDGNYCMYDDSYNEITESFLKEVLGENLSGDVNYDDLLVSSLITAAPHYIVIHNLSNVKNKEIIETIKNVFCDRVKICPGCSLCNSMSPLHKM